MKLISWNVNGIRAVVKKGFLDFFIKEDSDIFCIQETKLQDGQISLELPGYHQYWSHAERKGYSGTAVFSKVEPISVRFDIGVEELDDEGRITALEFEDFWVVSVYAPNSQEKLARIDHRMAWEDAFHKFVSELDATKSVIICGDMNVAHNEIDLKNPGPNRRNAGFSDAEREKLTRLLESGFTDTFRMIYPEMAGAYSWWSYRFNARANNAGWRIDYFLVSNRISDKVQDALIYGDVFGSDHCPVGLLLDI